MTDPVSAVGSSLWVTSPAAGAGSPDKSLDQDTFLRLLVAQMKYQDPLHPTDGTQFITQTAQLTMVDRLNSMAKGQELLEASSMIGRSVNYIDVNTGNPVTGRVTGTLLNSDGPVLTVSTPSGTANVPLAQVTAVAEVQN